MTSLWGQGAKAGRPDLNGVWQLNVAESDFGQVPPPTKQSEEITQAGEEMAIAISIERPETKQNYTLRFRVGSGETPMESLFPLKAPFRVLSVKGDWVGAALVMTEKVEFQGATGTLEARYQLIAGGKKLKKTTHVVMQEGTLDTTTVYDRE
ncbi:MAG TPA: hypothetical protein VL495_07510 [Edaphobacter sp.]|nr:hypothetical protein [Edaphobacter sp.]